VEINMNMIKTLIENHHLFSELDEEHDQPRINHPVYYRWVEQVVKCCKIDYEKAIDIAKNHRTVPEIFKPILIDVINELHKNNNLQEA
jgi:hypothetical protein